ncbi:MAG TPA: glycosyltransferase family 39 protein [bacterium]|nr:glycosyltransferase family 39 protein [bacterium]
MKDRPALIITATTVAIHLGVAGRYDLFRDELYFIVCGRHPAFGYVDQPPLVPLLAAAGATFGLQAAVVRLPAVAAAAALVWLVVAFTRLLGGGEAAAWLVGIAAAAAPMLMGLTATLNTTTFEPLAWTLIAYALARAVVLDDRRALVWAGVVAGVALEARYAIPLWLLALSVGIALTGPRRLLAWRELWLGVGLSAILGLPSLIWQALNGWPFIELMRNASMKNVHPGALVFTLHQVAVMNPASAPLWITGLIAPFLLRELRVMRFLPIAFALTALATVAAGGKDYYLAPAYPPFLVLGGIALAQALRPAAVRAAYIALIVALGAITAPLALPLLDPPALVAYTRTMHLAPRPQERSQLGTLLPPTFADMLGWHDFVAEVAAAYAGIPIAQRAKTSILVANYGEAAALDLYGSSDGLPPALSGQNQYGLWGLRGQSPLDVLLVTRGDVEWLRPHCVELLALGRTWSRYVLPFENSNAIVWCRGLHPSLAELWARIRFVE